jgi:hypothetical protein
LKSVVNYSINVEVLKAFNEEVEDQTRSRLIEALMIEFLVKYSRGPGEAHEDVDSNLLQKEIT